MITGATANTEMTGPTPHSPFTDLDTIGIKFGNPFVITTSEYQSSVGPWMVMHVIGI
jgi:hypothetical protein